MTEQDDGVMTVLPLCDVIADLTLQPRTCGLNYEHVGEIAEAYREGKKVPAPIVYLLPDGTKLLTRGFHRYHAARKAGLEKLTFEVRTGSRKDAVIDAASVRLEHSALNMTHNDRRRAALLLYEQLPKNIGGEVIAERVGSHRHTVERWIIEEHADRATQATRIGRDGKEMPRSNQHIGKATTNSTGEAAAKYQRPNGKPRRTAVIPPTVSGQTKGEDTSTVAILTRIDGWRLQLDWLKKDMKDAFEPSHPVAKYLGIGAMIDSLADVIQSIEDGSPTRICPNCEVLGGKGSCPVCLGYRFVPPSVADKLTKKPK